MDDSKPFCESNCSLLKLGMTTRVDHKIIKWLENKTNSPKDDQIFTFVGYSKLTSFRIRGPTSFIKGNLKKRKFRLKIQTDVFLFHLLN